MTLLFFPQILLLAGLLYLFINFNKPLLCAAIYTVLHFVLSLILGFALVPILIATGVQFVLALLYFSLLGKVQKGLLWWIILVAGFTIIIFNSKLAYMVVF